MGWFFVVVGGIGTVLPLLPTTPFLILALVFFSKSSPRFHRMLLNNAWFGPALRQWESRKSLTRRTKLQAYLVIIVTFSVSVVLFDGRRSLQGLLVGIAIILLLIVWRLREEPMEEGSVDLE